MADALNAFVVLFIVVDPVGIAWIFSSLTVGYELRDQRRMAIQGVSFALFFMYLFFFLGELLLNWMGISLAAFRIAGGILLFLLALEMVFARQSGLRSTTLSEHHEAQQKQDLSVFPLAFPLLAGPGALATVMLMSGHIETLEQRMTMSVVILLVGAVTISALFMSRFLSKRLGETGANVISRLLGLILSALAVQYVIDGIKQSFFS
jgi:multiple antibiotic resistance protein